jgi:hypothetical protein
VSATQLSLLVDLLPDNEIAEPTVKRPSVPVAKLIDGRWCWKAFGSDEYIHEPELEQILLAALTRQERRKAA